ncbi:MAG: RNA polymerase sigma factor [Butyricimonas faecihominis]
MLFEFVNKLPEKYRLVFNLYVMEDMQHKEIAALLGISDGTSKSNLARAKEILKRKINAYLRDGRRLRNYLKTLWNKFPLNLQHECGKE